LTLEDIELERLYGQAMDATRTALVRRHLTYVSASSWVTRLNYALTAPVYRQRRIDDIAMKALIILGGYRVPSKFENVSHKQQGR